jgi:hypothetical protein
MPRDRRRLTNLTEDEVDSRMGHPDNPSTVECTIEFLRRTIVKLDKTTKEQTNVMI